MSSSWIEPTDTGTPWTLLNLSNLKDRMTWPLIKCTVTLLLLLLFGE